MTAARPHPDLRDLLFADLPPARARKVFAAAGAAGSSLLAMLNAADAHDAAAAATALAAIEEGKPETRLLLQALALARYAGANDAGVAHEVLGVVVDVALDAGLDTVAAYADGSARYLNHGGGAVIWDTYDMTVWQLGRALLDAGGAIAVMTGAAFGPRPEPPPTGQVMLSVLTRGGLHFGMGPFGAMEADPWGGPVISAATALMAHLIERSGR